MKVGYDNKSNQECLFETSCHDDEWIIKAASQGYRLQGI